MKKEGVFLQQQSSLQEEMWGIKNFFSEKAGKGFKVRRFQEGGVEKEQRKNAWPYKGRPGSSE